MHEYKHVYIQNQQTEMRTYIHTCIHSSIHTYIITYIHTYNQSNTRTSIHTCINREVRCQAQQGKVGRVWGGRNGNNVTHVMNVYVVNWVITFSPVIELGLRHPANQERKCCTWVMSHTWMSHTTRATGWNRKLPLMSPVKHMKLYKHLASIKTTLHTAGCT